MALNAAAVQPPLNVESTLAYPLPNIAIDSQRLLDDLRKMEEGLWRPQMLYSSPEGRRSGKPDNPNWDLIALYSVNGDMHDLRSADHPPVHKTAAGELCPYICTELLPQFKAPPLRVVFSRLRAGARIGEHRDYGENRFNTGVVRVHIPVITNDRVVMYLAGNPYYFPLGTAWYFDASERHAVQNNSDQDRIHVLADFKVGPALEKLLKPLTMNDRLRFARHTVDYYREIAKAFVHHVQTKQGRARIRARAAIVFRRPGSR